MKIKNNGYIFENDIFELFPWIQTSVHRFIAVISYFTTFN